MKPQILELIEEIEFLVGRLLRTPIVEKIVGDASGRVTGVQLDKNCPSAARERFSMAHEIAASNEKEIRSEMETLRSDIELTKQAGGDTTELEARFNMQKERRKIAVENMSKLESIESDYAAKFKPSENKYDQRAHAMFLEQSRQRLQARKAEAESSSMPDYDRIEALDRRLARVDTAQKESRTWLEANDKGWVGMRDRAKAAAEQESSGAKKGKGKPVAPTTDKSTSGTTGVTGAATSPSGGTGAAAPTTGVTGATKTKKATDATGAAAPTPTDKEKKGMATVAMQAKPGDVWQTKTGFGAKNQSGSVGNVKGVRYFKSEQDAKVFSGIGTQEQPRRRNPDRKPVEKKPQQKPTKKTPKNPAVVETVKTIVDKVLNEKWSQKYKDSIDCENPKGFSQRAHCRGKEIEETYRDSGLGKWFRQSADGTPGWDRYNSKGERIGKCGDADEGEAYAACLSPEKAQKLGKEGIASFVRRKRSAQREAGMGKKGEGKPGGGAEPVRVSTGVNKVQEGKEVSVDEMKQAIKDLIDLIKKHEKLAYEAKKAGDKKEHNKQRGIVAEFSADIKTVQDMIKRALRDNKTGLTITEEDGEGKPLNKPFRTPGEKKKFAVYTKNDNGNIVKVRFGDPNMSIKRDDPDRLKAFRSRHSCDDDVGPKWKARYWSCQMWRSDKSVNDILGEASENEPTNPELWGKVQDLVAGRISSMEHGGETITGPNDGKGFDVHPSAYSNAWASKLYKRLGGGWRKKSSTNEQVSKLASSIVEKRLKR